MATRRTSHMTEEQRQLLRRVSRELAPHFAGETIKLYVPSPDVDLRSDMRKARSQRIVSALQGGEEPATIAARERVTASYVRAFRGRIKSGSGDGGASAPP